MYGNCGSVSYFCINFELIDSISIYFSTGPITWAKKYPIAATGQRQSPIDFNGENCTVCKDSSVFKPLEAKYPLVINQLKMVNSGNGWRVDIPSDYVNDTFLKGGPLQHKYRLEQFHCHWGKNCESGSEHTVNGKYYAAELHFVHWNCDLFNNFKEAAKEDKGLAVLGVFLESSEIKHEEFEKITSMLKEIPYKGDETFIPRISIDNILPKNRSYWTYEGSLTTPPLYESVSWIVFKEPIRVHETQIDEFRKLFHTSKESKEPLKVIENYRPVQPLCGRSVAFVEYA
ncbi:carbonic anhydrase-like protein 2 [Dinothrombium tinctorium]|uniref:Carbonic anhydrase n=1 Tax=Dinothrombium tinctorium TaxID=1965070 RepID=A0A443R2D7_9ACAR|nr:carbonic anhydrase-like protein 2 [Dinothrombium tinctorium]